MHSRKRFLLKKYFFLFTNQIVQKFVIQKKQKNEIYNVQYVSNDVEPFRGSSYCLILNFKI